MKLKINYSTKGGSSSSTTSSSMSSNFNNKKLKENVPMNIITIGILNSGDLKILNKWMDEVKKIIEGKIPNEIEIKILHYDGLNEINSNSVDANQIDKNDLITRLKNSFNYFNFVEYDDFLNAKDIDNFNINKDYIYFKDFDKEELNDFVETNYLIFDFAHIFSSDEIKQYNIITLGYESINKDYLLNDCFKIDKNDNIIIYSDIIFDKLILNIDQNYPFDEKYPDRFFEKYIPLNSDHYGHIFNILETSLNLKGNHNLYTYDNLITVLKLGIIHNNLGQKIMNDLYEINNKIEKVNYDIIFYEKYILNLIEDLKKFI